jgi:hypothetical protein
MMNEIVFMTGQRRDQDGDLTVTSTPVPQPRAARSTRATRSPTEN